MWLVGTAVAMYGTVKESGTLVSLHGRKEDRPEAVLARGDVKD